MKVIVNLFKKMTYKQIVWYSIILLFFVSSVFFVYHNHSFYERPLVEVIEIELADSTEMIDMHENKDRLYIQQIVAEIKNGDHKGQHIHLTNEYSISGAYDQEYHVGNELFVSIDTKKKGRYRFNWKHN
ncbi:putative membrane protein [Neobacillus niacini]|nr:putative membrane protein [Neobacillus niacini]